MFRTRDEHFSINNRNNWSIRNCWKTLCLSTWSTSTLCCMWMGSLSGRPSTTPTIRAMVALHNIFSATKNTTLAQCLINSFYLFQRHDPVKSPHSQPSPLLLTPLRWSVSATSTRSPIPFLRCALFCLLMSASTTNIVARSSIPAPVGTFLMFWWIVQQSTSTLNALFFSSPMLWCLRVLQQSTLVRAPPLLQPAPGSHFWSSATWTTLFFYYSDITYHPSYLLQCRL